MTTETAESPRSLGRYELVHPLGQGGMGEVYLAKISGAAGFEKPCIVKTILPTLLKDRQFLDRFHHEARVLVHLVHSSIAQVYDMGETNGTYYMALEYVAGVDVAYLAEQARALNHAIPVPVALYLGQRVAEGLGYAHRKAGPDGTPLGIVHRDVSPHNVMVSYEGEVKVIDFGLAKSAARSKYTLPSTVMGKLGYMSPEQARAEALDHRSDIYSCAVMVWELIAGRPLIGHGTVGEMMAAMANPSAPALHELRPDVDPAVDAVVRRALAPKPDDRYSRSDEFARALNEQLLRASSSLGAEEVGNFVKEICPEAFSSQRKLISRISGVRRSPSTPPTTGVMPPEGLSSLPGGAESVGALESTSLRPLSEMQASTASPTPRPLTTPLPGAPMSAAQRVPSGVGFAQTLVPGSTPAAAPQSGPAPLAAAQSGAVAPASGFSRAKLMGSALALLVLMIGTASATVYFMQQGSGAGPQLVAHGGEHPPPDGDPNWRPPPPEPGRPHRPPPPPLNGHPLPPPPEGWRPGEGPQGAAAHPGEPDPHAPGKTVAASAGPAETASAAHAVGTEATAATVPAIAKLPATPAGQGSKQKEAKSISMWITPKRVMEVHFNKKEKHVVRGTSLAGLKLDDVVDLVGPDEGGKRRVLGSAKVKKQGKNGTHLSLDKAARESEEAIYVVVPDGAGPGEVAAAPVTAEPPPVSPPSPPPPKTLALGVRRTGMKILGPLGQLDPGYIIHSSEKTALSSCVATVGNGFRYEFKSLIRGENKVDRGDFKHLNGAPVVPEGQMLIQCTEGIANAKIQPPK